MVENSCVTYLCVEENNLVSLELRIKGEIDIFTIVLKFRRQWFSHGSSATSQRNTCE